MGAQAAALLDAGGPVGAVPPPAAAVGSLRLAPPARYELDRVARGHAGVGLAPSAYDGTRLHRILPGGVPVVVAPDLTVTWSVPADPDEVRRALTGVLCLDDDLTGLHDACDRVPSLSWVRPAGAGRVLRAPSAFEDLAGVLASTNTSYAATRRMVGAVVRGAFPSPDEVL
ncbi:MAG: putative ribosylglycoyhydrolase, partial [Frankiales bacterium]|nr:putative ribosylglycoyhydrolase [Frankiales bacterium]